MKCPTNWGVQICTHSSINTVGDICRQASNGCAANKNMQTCRFSATSTAYFVFVYVGVPTFYLYASPPPPPFRPGIGGVVDACQIAGYNRDGTFYVISPGMAGEPCPDDKYLSVSKV